MTILSRAYKHRFAIAVRIGPILRSGFRSMVPAQSPPLIATPQDQNPHKFGTVEAFIGSSAKKDQNPKREKMLIIKSLEAAARATQKQKFRFDKLGKPEYIYTNTAGGRVLKELEELKTDFEREKIRNREWQIIMRPAQKATIAIRQRLFEKYCKGIGKGTPAGKAAIKLGNEAAHEGDIILDSILIKQGDIIDTSTFCSVYGVAWGSESLQNYQSMYPATVELLFTKNNRFTDYCENVG